MKSYFVLIVFSLSSFLFSCSEDEQRTCTTCSSELTTSFELCREGDGNASVNGENTSTPYDVYLDSLVETGVSCSN